MNNGGISSQEARVIIEYKKVAFDMIQHSFSDLSKKEINDAIDYSILKRCKNYNVKLHNNYKNAELNTTALEMAEYILKMEPIITAQGVMFRKHADTENPLGKMVEGFLDTRGVYKKEMFKYPKGSDMFNHFNLLQLLSKIDCNAIYGCLGNYSSVFYNLYVSPTITTVGRSLISTAGMFFEGFLGANAKFMSLDDIVTFIHNVEGEKNERKYNDYVVLDSNISVRECAYALLTNCGFEFMFMADETTNQKQTKGFGYIPSSEDMNIVLDILYDIEARDPETLNRLFYKNNLYSFMDNKAVTKRVLNILSKLQGPMMDPNHAPEEIKDELNEFCDLLKEYVYYGHQWIDKMERYRGMIRKVNALTDTDSCVTSFDPIYHCVLQKVVENNCDFRIMHANVDMFKFVDNDEFGDPKELQECIWFDDDDLDYDFFTDDIIAMQKTIDPLTIIPQESLRYSIINIFAYCVTTLINDYMVRFTQNCNSYSPDRACRIIMKNEFLFKSILLKLDAKKNYATIQELQEGNIVPANKQLDIKGLPLNKSSLQDSTRERLKRIMFEDVLKCEELDQVKIIKELAIFEKEIFNNINSGKKDYYKPVKIRAFTSYPNPMGQMGVKGAVAFNEIMDGDKIDLTQRNSLDVLKVDIDKKKIAHLEQSNPELYQKILNLIEQPEYKGSLTAISFPKEYEVPDWVLEFADYTTIINNNLKAFPADMLGIFKGNDNNNYSNIVPL